MRLKARGELLVDDKPIFNTNVIDLVNDIVRQRNRSAHHGWKVIAKGLTDINVPQELVGNKKRWEWIARRHPAQDIKETITDSPICPVTPAKYIAWEIY